MEKEKIAVIDMGTNTFHLLIAEKQDGKPKVLVNDKISVKIGQGGISKGFIASDAYERALRTLTRFKNTINAHEVKKTFAIATSAIRNAGNGFILAKDIKVKTGIELQVISGEKEAELIYEGVRYGMNLGKSPSVIMDIGGGSVEFIIGNQHEIMWKQSFEIGAQRLLDRFHKQDPIHADEIRELNRYLDGALMPLFEALQIYKPATLVGSSGTFDTLCDIDVIKKGIDFSIEKQIEYTVGIPDFESIAADIIVKTRDERMQIPGMAEMRVDMIVVACLLIQFIHKKFSFEKIKVCAYALKEGVLSRAIEGKEL